MYDQNDTYEIPFKLLTRKGARVFGKLVRIWATEGPPAEAKNKKGSASMKVEKLIKILMKEGLKEGYDYKVREGVKKIKLQSRKQDTATFLMPEAAAIKRFETPGSHNVDLPSQYLEILLNPQLSDAYQNSYANYPYQIDGEGYEKFLDPFMASYMCMQCA